MFSAEFRTTNWRRVKFKNSKIEFVIFCIFELLLVAWRTILMEKIVKKCGQRIIWISVNDQQLVLLKLLIHRRIWIAYYFENLVPLQHAVFFPFFFNFVFHFYNIHICNDNFFIRKNKFRYFQRGINKIYMESGKKLRNFFIYQLLNWKRPCVGDLRIKSEIQNSFIHFFYYINEIFVFVNISLTCIRKHYLLSYFQLAQCRGYVVNEVRYRFYTLYSNCELR